MEEEEEEELNQYARALLRQAVAQSMGKLPVLTRPSAKASVRARPPPPSAPQPRPPPPPTAAQRLTVRMQFFHAGATRRRPPKPESTVDSNDDGRLPPVPEMWAYLPGSAYGTPPILKEPDPEPLGDEGDGRDHAGSSADRL